MLVISRPSRGAYCTDCTYKKPRNTKDFGASSSRPRKDPSFVRSERRRQSAFSRLLRVLRSTREKHHSPVVRVFVWKPAPNITSNSAECTRRPLSSRKKFSVISEAEVDDMPAELRIWCRKNQWSKVNQWQPWTAQKTRAIDRSKVTGLLFVVPGVRPHVFLLVLTDYHSNFIFRRDYVFILLQFTLLRHDKQLNVIYVSYFTLCIVKRQRRTNLLDLAFCLIVLTDVFF